MKNNRIKKKITFLTLTLLFLASFTATIVHAAVAFSYEGWNIKGKNSLSSTYLSKRQKVTIKHYQRRDYNRSGVGLRVEIQRHNGWT